MVAVAGLCVALALEALGGEFVVTSPGKVFEENILAFYVGVDLAYETVFLGLSLLDGLRNPVGPADAKAMGCIGIGGFACGVVACHRHPAQGVVGVGAVAALFAVCGRILQ